MGIKANGHGGLTDEEAQIARRELRTSKRSMAAIAFDILGLNSVRPVQKLNAREGIRVYFDLPNTRKWHVNSNAD